MDNQIPPVPPVPPAPLVPPIPPVLPPAEKSQNWLKILLGVVGVLIILGLFGNLYLLAKKSKPVTEITPTPTQLAATPTIDLTANWKTYINTKYNYSVKYPAEWFIYDKGTYWPPEKIYKNAKEIVFISPQQRENLTPGGFSLMNSILIRGDMGAILESEIDKNVYKVEKIQLGAILATKVTTISQPAMGGLETNYYFLNKNINFQIAFPNQDLQGTHDSTFDQILSTFQFLD